MLPLEQKPIISVPENPRLSAAKSLVGCIRTQLTESARALGLTSYRPVRLLDRQSARYRRLQIRLVLSPMWKMITSEGNQSYSPGGVSVNDHGYGHHCTRAGCFTGDRILITKTN